MAQRKLQAEIDRTLKAVTTGVEVFESTFEKLGMSSNATQKDKLETDLKTQIKKLQRMRDTIKNWIGSSDIKDKSALTDSRKLIEAQMERFKALEKEMKMKAFSKEGLIAQAKLDPAERAKKEMVDWIGTTVDELSRQIEQTEAEMELVQGGNKKKKAMGEKMSELEELNERRVWHNSKLEIVQRMLENGQLQTDQVEVIQEDVKYFVEANAEEDFDFDDGLYEDLNLQEEDEYLQDISHNDDLSNLDSSSAIDLTEATTPPVTATALKTPAKEDKKERTVSTASASASAAKPTSAPTTEDPPSPILAKKQISRKSTLDNTSAKAELPKAKETVPPVPTPTQKTSMPPIRYAAAVAGPATAASAASAAAAPAPSVSGQEISASPVENKSELPELTPAISEPPREEKELALPPTQAPPPVSEPTPAPAPQASTNGHLPPPPPGLVSTSPALSQPQHHPAYSQTGPSPAQSIPPPGYSQPQPQSQPQAQPQAQAQRPQQQQQQQQQHGESSRAGAYSTSPRAPPGVLSGLMQTFETAKGLSEQRSGDLTELHNALDGSFNNAPSQLDGEPPRYYHPKNRVKTPLYYPQTRLRHLTDRAVISRMDVDQLFFIFYYREGTYEQWCAAEELKKQAWRFHKQYLTWFQRAASPTAVTDDYEQGPYTYFDWENAWCTRRKTDFRFEYRYLSEY